MKLNIKTRMIINGVLTVMVSISLAMTIVFIIVNKQGKTNAVKRIDQALSVVAGQYNDLEAGLMKQGENIGRADLLVSQQVMINEFIEMGEDNRFANKRLAESLSGQLQNMSLNKAVVYGSGGKWICAVRVLGNKIHILSSIKPGEMKYNEVKIDPGQVPVDRDYTPSSEPLFFKPSLDLPLTDKILLSRSTKDNTLWLDVISPLIDNSQGGNTQAGLIVISQRVGKDFIQRVSDYTGTQVNLFLDNILSVGAMSGYNKLDAQGREVKNIEKKPGIEKAGGIFRDIELSAESFYEGLYPFFGNDQQIGAFSILLSQAESRENARQMLFWLLVIAAACLAGVTPLTWFFANSIVKSITRVTESLKDVAQGEGDLTKRIEIKSDDEIGELSKWFNTFIEKLQVIITDISKNSKNLTQLASVTEEESEKISQSASDMAEVTQGVTAATDEMSSSISSIADVMDQASDNLSIVASSTEEMTATINEIAKNAENARNMSLETGQKIKSASSHVDQLEKDAKEIDTFTEGINEISEQTNLLALNATIEAARAGEAGKGFAVVAGEIKELARQTATATRDIKKKVETIRQSTDYTINEMTLISSTFGDMDDMVNEIASAIEQQSATTKEIADNSSTVAGGINDVTQSVSQFDEMTSKIAEDMSRVNDSSFQMSENCGKINSDAGEMHKETGNLDDLLHKFVIE